MQTCIFCISAADIFIVVECIFIIFWQPLFFIIAVLDIRLQDIIMFMSAADILVEDIEEWSIDVFGVCAFAGAPAATARTIEASRIFVGFITHLRRGNRRGDIPERACGILVPREHPHSSAFNFDRITDATGGATAFLRLGLKSEPCGPRKCIDEPNDNYAHAHRGGKKQRQERMHDLRRENHERAGDAERPDGAETLATRTGTECLDDLAVRHRPATARGDHAAKFRA